MENRRSLFERRKPHPPSFAARNVYSAGPSGDNSSRSRYASGSNAPRYDHAFRVNATWAGRDSGDNAPWSRCGARDSTFRVAPFAYEPGDRRRDCLNRVDCLSSIQMKQVGHIFGSTPWTSSRLSGGFSRLGQYPGDSPYNKWCFSYAGPSGAPWTRCSIDTPECKNGYNGPLSSMPNRWRTDDPCSENGSPIPFTEPPAPTFAPGSQVPVVPGPAGSPTPVVPPYTAPPSPSQAPAGQGIPTIPLPPFPQAPAPAQVPLQPSGFGPSRMPCGQSRISYMVRDLANVTRVSSVENFDPRFKWVQ